MKNTFAVIMLSSLVFGACLAPSGAQRCIQNCNTAVYFPICATNGRDWITFHNECRLRVHNCNRIRNPMRKVRNGPCNRNGYR